MSIPFWPEYQVEVAEDMVSESGRTYGQCMIRTRYPVDASHKFTESEIADGFTLISVPYSYSLHGGPPGSSPGDVLSSERSKVWLESEDAATTFAAGVEESVGTAAWEKMEAHLAAREDS